MLLRTPGARSDERTLAQASVSSSTDYADLGERAHRRDDARRDRARERHQPRAPKHVYAANAGGSSGSARVGGRYESLHAYEHTSVDSARC